MHLVQNNIDNNNNNKTVDKYTLSMRQQRKEYYITKFYCSKFSFFFQFIAFYCLGFYSEISSKP